MIGRLSDPYPHTDWMGINRKREVDAAVREGLRRDYERSGSAVTRSMPLTEYVATMLNILEDGWEPLTMSRISQAWREQHA